MPPHTAGAHWILSAQNVCLEVLLISFSDHGGQLGTWYCAKSVILRNNLPTNSSSAVHAEKPLHTHQPVVIYITVAFRLSVTFWLNVTFDPWLEQGILLRMEIHVIFLLLRTIFCWPMAWTHKKQGTHGLFKRYHNNPGQVSKDTGGGHKEGNMIRDKRNARRDFKVNSNTWQHLHHI